MKYIEIILKVAFVAGAGVFFTAGDMFMTYFSSFLLVCILLGIILLFNKDQSYGYKLAKREVVMRRIEGAVLIVFTLVAACLKFTA